MALKINKQNINLSITKGSMYSPYEPEHFLGFFNLWIRIRQPFLMRIRIRNTALTGSGLNPDLTI